MQDCKEQYDREIGGYTYGTLTCNDKFYFIIRDKKIDPERAHNYSINPEIKPGVEFTTRALWYRIEFEQKPYLCIFSAIS